MVRGLPFRQVSPIYILRACGGCSSTDAYYIIAGGQVFIAFGFEKLHLYTYQRRLPLSEFPACSFAPVLAQQGTARHLSMPSPVAGWVLTLSFPCPAAYVRTISGCEWDPVREWFSGWSVCCVGFLVVTSRTGYPLPRGGFSPVSLEGQAYPITSGGSVEAVSL